MGIVEIKRKPKYPITPDSNKVCYLVLHLGLPLKSSYSTSKALTEETKVAKTLGLKLQSINLDTENSSSVQGTPRYLIRFPYFRRDDILASQIVDTLLIAASITFGPFLEEREQISTFRIPWNLVKDRDNVLVGELVQIEELRNWNERVTEFPTTLIGSTSRFSEYEVGSAWNLLPLLLQDDSLLRAFRFLKTSQENFYVWTGEIDEAIDQAYRTAENAFQQSRMENALEDSFKAIEAVVGDPPKNESKFRANLVNKGIDPDEEFGLEDKPVSQVIREMNIARDKKVAHGSTSNRTISIREVLTYQNCARFVVLKASEKKLGFKL